MTLGPAEDSEGIEGGSEELHHLLRRQLRRAGIVGGAPPDAVAWQAFVERVNRVYRDADQQRYLNDRAFRVSSRELQQLNEELRRASETQLALERDRLQTVFDSVPYGLLVVDVEGRVVELNDPAELLLGVGAGECAGQPLFEILGMVDREGAALRDRIGQAQPWRASDTTAARRDGGSFPAALEFRPLMSRGLPAGGVLSVVDLGERKQREIEMAWQASHDEHTGLLNRAAMLERIEQALERSRRASTTCALIFLDLDRFKMVNDTLGHSAGDQLLTLAAARLAKLLRKSDVIARLGGDEFLVLAEGVRGVADVAPICDRLGEALRVPFELVDGTPEEGAELESELAYVTGSMGVAIADADSTTESLLRDADVALYAAKREGGDDWIAFDVTMRDAVKRQVRLERDMRRALADEEFELHFQPVFRVLDQPGDGSLDGVGPWVGDGVDGDEDNRRAANVRIVGFEALLRWYSPEGPIPPAVFIPLAEESPLIHRLGDFVARETARFVRELLDVRPDHPWCVAMNVSAAQLTHGDLPGLLSEVLEESGVPGERLMVEITESALIGDPDIADSHLRLIEDLGVGIALDDFGTGFSSLTSLRRFPISTLKVDRSFTADLAESPRAEAIVRAVVDLGHALGLKVVAEGVETADGLARVVALGCDVLQGYYLGRPMPWADALALAQHELPTA